MSPGVEWNRAGRFQIAAIVCLAYACLVAPWSRAGVAQAPPPDTVVLNGRILTVDPSFSIAQAVAIRGGRFVAVGTTADIQKLVGPGTRTIDLQGRTAIPGLADGHLHSAGGGPGVDLSRARSIDDVLDAISQRIAKSKPGDVIVTNSDWHEAQLKEQRLPLRRDLDKVSPNNPVVAVRGGHEYIVNSAALAKWKLDKSTPEPSGGKISRYEDGDLNGEVIDAAKAFIVLPPPPEKTLDERIADQVSELKTLNAVGLTSIRLPGTSVDQYRLLQEIQKRGLLTMRVNVLLRPAPPALASASALEARRPRMGRRVRRRRRMGADRWRQAGG